MLGNLKGAREALIEAVQINSKFAPAHFNLANVYRDLGSYEEAGSYEACIALEPRNPRFQNNLGNLLIKLGRPKTAVVYLMNAAKLNRKLRFINLTLQIYSRGWVNMLTPSFSIKKLLKLSLKMQNSERIT